jgi:hypothetical protein
MFQCQIAIDRHSPRIIPNQCHSSATPHFSLPSTFNPNRKLAVLLQVFLGLGRLVLNLPFKLLVIFTTIGLVIGGIWGTLNLDQANQYYFYALEAHIMYLQLLLISNKFCNGGERPEQEEQVFYAPPPPSPSVWALKPLS